MATDAGFIDKLTLETEDRRLLVISNEDNPSAVIIVGNSSVGDGTTTVATAGTAVQLPNVAVKRVLIQAHQDNTTEVFIGGSTVVAAAAGRRGLGMWAGNWQEFKVTNLNLLYVDAVTSGEKIIYYYES